MQVLPDADGTQERKLPVLCGNPVPFGENHIRFQFLQQFSGFGKSFQHTERIGEVLYVKITSQFTGGYSVIRNSHFFDELTLNTFIGTNIGNLISGSFECRDQGDVRGNVAGSTTAGKNNMFHREFLLKNLFINHNYEPPGQNCQGEIELSFV